MAPGRSQSRDTRRKAVRRGSGDSSIQDLCSCLYAYSTNQTAAFAHDVIHQAFIRVLNDIQDDVAGIVEDSRVLLNCEYNYLQDS